MQQESDNVLILLRDNVLIQQEETYNVLIQQESVRDNVLIQQESRDLIM
jgi:hypothetical protein